MTLTQLLHFNMTLPINSVMVYNSEQYKSWYHKNNKELLEKKKIWRDNNKDKIKAQNKRSHVKIKRNIMNHYSEGKMECKCCGQNYFWHLTIEHINGGGNKHREQVGEGANFYQWLKNNNYPEGFEVLCYNCNCGRRATNNKCEHRSG